MQQRSLRIRKWASLLATAALFLGMVPGAAFAAPVPTGTPGSYTVDNFADLQTALADSSMSTITLTADISSTAQLHVMRAVTIDGAGHKLTVTTNLGTVNGSKHALSFEASQSPVLVKDLTIDSAALAYGVNTYNNALVTLAGVSLRNSRGAGLTVNGATVTATNLSTSGNAWGAVNVDPGSGVNTPSSFTFTSGTLAETNKIWSDGANVTPTATVTVTAPASYVECSIGGVACWAPPVVVTAIGTGHGAVTPASQLADPGSAATVTVSPDAGYYCSELRVDGVATAPVSAYRFANVGLQSHNVTATFSALSPFETFDFSPILASVMTSGAWYTDRYAPAGFAKASFDGDKRLKLSISSADSAANRPPSYSSSFYNTQGRNFDLAQISDVVFADVYIGSDWDTNSRRADLWANAVDIGGDIVGYPIVGFVNGTGFRVWDNLGWHTVGFPAGFSYGKWYNLRMQRNADSISYYVDNALVYVSDFAVDTDVASSVGFDNVKLQSYNFGESYDVFFDNVGPISPTPAPYTISTSAGAHGTVVPSNPGVDAGDSTTITVASATGYHIDNVIVDGVSVGASSTIVFSNVTANHQVSATFAINSYTITASAGSAGLISPAGVASKTYGADATYTFTPFPGYHVADVLVDGASVGAPADYTFSNVAANHTIAVTFARTTYSVTSTIGANGSATWSGARTVGEGSNLTIAFTPDDGYKIADVLVDGVSQGAIGSYGFVDIAANHTVAVSFTKTTYTIAVSGGPNGTISSVPVMTVAIGDDATFLITPAKGFHVAGVLVDGASVGAVTSYTFRNVVANHRISVTFAVNPKVRLSAPIAPASASRTRSFATYGFLKPRHTAGTYPVRIYKWQLVSGKWKRRGYVNAKASNYSTYTKFARRIRLSHAGKWRLRAYAPADSKHAATWSAKFDYVKVR